MKGMTMRRMTAGLLTLTALTFGVASAAAAPPGGGLITDGPYDCHGVQTTIVHSVGNSAYIGAQQYIVESFTFTSADGTTETKSFGHKRGLSDPLTCNQTDPAGTFSVVLLAVPPQRD